MPDSRPWWQRTFDFGDFDDRISRAGGAGNASQQIDALRTGAGGAAYPAMRGLDPAQYASFDRYAQGANLAAQNPGVRGWIARGAAVPLAALYEAGKYYPPALNAVAKVPGFESFAVDETTSPPSWRNVAALAGGMFRGESRGAERYVSPQTRLRILQSLETLGE